MSSSELRVKPADYSKLKNVKRHINCVATPIVADPDAHGLVITGRDGGYSIIRVMDVQPEPGRYVVRVDEVGRGAYGYDTREDALADRAYYADLLDTGGIALLRKLADRVGASPYNRNVGFSMSVYPDGAVRLSAMGGSKNSVDPNRLIHITFASEAVLRKVLGATTTSVSPAWIEELLSKAGEANEKS